MYISRFKKKYLSIIQKLKKKLNYKSIMQVPKIEKIVLSKGVGRAVLDKKLIEYSIHELTQISGQKAIPCFSKKDESGFKLRKGVAIGCKVTIRSNIMYDFLDKLINVALPRVRDFNGIKLNGFDGTGNYNLGITEQIIFPEIDIDKIDKISGLNISIITSSLKDDIAYCLLQSLGLPFKKKQ